MKHIKSYINEQISTPEKWSQKDIHKVDRKKFKQDLHAAIKEYVRDNGAWKKRPGKYWREYDPAAVTEFKKEFVNPYLEKRYGPLTTKFQKIVDLELLSVKQEEKVLME